MMHNNFINYLKNERHYSLETIKSYSHDVVQFFKLTDLEYDFLAYGCFIKNSLFQ